MELLIGAVIGVVLERVTKVLENLYITLRHALERPRQTLGNLTFYGCSVLASGSSTPSPSALLDLTRLYQALESAVSLTAYVMPCVRFNRFVR
jgi:hypothetical protein